MADLSEFLERLRGKDRGEIIRLLEQKGDALQAAARKRSGRSRKEFLDAGGMGEVERVNRFLYFLRHDAIPDRMSEADIVLSRSL